MDIDGVVTCVALLRNYLFPVGGVQELEHLALPGFNDHEVRDIRLYNH